MSHSVYEGDREAFFESMPFSELVLGEWIPMKCATVDKHGNRCTNEPEHNYCADTVLCDQCYTNLQKRMKNRENSGGFLEEVEIPF